MRLLVFSDLHLHPFRAFADYSSGDNSRRMLALDHLEQIVNQANSFPGCDAVVFAGDFFHDRNSVDPVSLHKANAILERLHVPFFAASGTHDLSRENFSALRLLRLPAGSKVDESFEFIDKSLHSWTFILVPDPLDYGSHQEKIERALAGLSPELLPNPKILVSHGYVVGAFPHPFWVEKGLDAAWLEVNFEFSILGHVHESGSEGAILVPGHSIPQGFGDSGAGMVWGIDLVPKQDAVEIGKIKFFFLNPKFETVLDTFTDFRPGCFYRIQTNSRTFGLPEGVKGEVVYMGIRQEDEERVEEVVPASSTPAEVVSNISASFPEENRALLKKVGEFLVSSSSPVVPLDEVKEIISWHGPDIKEAEEA